MAKFSKKYKTRGRKTHGRKTRGRKTHGRKTRARSRAVKKGGEHPLVTKCLERCHKVHPGWTYEECKYYGYC